MRVSSTSSDDALDPLEQISSADLARAFARGELLLYYQPLFDARAQRVAGAEALLRWRRGRDGVALPGRFVPRLEANGLIVPVGARVLEMACAQLHRWRNEGRLVGRVAVNLSAVQFEHEGLVAAVLRAIEAAHLEPPDLELEITESALMLDTPRTERAVAALKARGVRIAIDDFGTGYSSLAYLHRFPVDTLKIDRSFIAQLGASPHGAAIVVAVIGLAHKLGIEVVAEGVETDAQRTFLEAEGCDLLQGFLLGAPAEP